MTVDDVQHIIEAWAPPWIAWERDNVGLQVGDPRRPVRRILLTLDVTRGVVEEAKRKKADLIVSHHPLLFRPPRTVNASEPLGELVLSLAESRIALIAAHTNLDFTRDGVSMTLAKNLGLQKVRFLAPLKGILAKVVAFVPAGHVHKVRDAMAGAGAGVIGEYDTCSFEVSGRGTFRGSEKSKPFVGQPGELETADEVRLEMVLPRARSQAVISALRAVHPYEEPAYDVYPIDNESPHYGMGALGELKSSLTLRAFLAKAKKSLHAEVLRFNGPARRSVKRVAVCGGSGSDLLGAAISAGADIFLTADVTYHRFHEAEDRISLVDAGHWETEHGVLSTVADRLKLTFRETGRAASVFITTLRTNPIHTL